MNEKDELGLSLLAEFKDKVNELVIHYDLDEDDNDLELLREINSKFMQNYYLARQRYLTILFNRGSIFVY